MLYMKNFGQCKVIYEKIKYENIIEKNVKKHIEKLKIYKK